MEMQVDELVLSHEDSTWQLVVSSRKTRADLILTFGGIRAMTESGATFSRWSTVVIVSVLAPRAMLTTNDYRPRTALLRHLKIHPAIVVRPGSSRQIQLGEWNLLPGLVVIEHP